MAKENKLNNTSRENKPQRKAGVSPAFIRRLQELAAQSDKPARQNQ
jgi:hypothetical protein